MAQQLSHQEASISKRIRIHFLDWNIAETTSCGTKILPAYLSTFMSECRKDTSMTEDVSIFTAARRPLPVLIERGPFAFEWCEMLCFMCGSFKHSCSVICIGMSDSTLTHVTTAISPFGVSVLLQVFLICATSFLWVFHLSPLASVCLAILTFSIVRCDKIKLSGPQSASDREVQESPRFVFKNDIQLLPYSHNLLPHVFNNLQQLLLSEDTGVGLVLSLTLNQISLLFDKPHSPRSRRDDSSVAHFSEENGSNDRTRVSLYLPCRTNSVDKGSSSAPLL
jgi:hypothetical protein